MLTPDQVYYASSDDINLPAFQNIPRAERYKFEILTHKLNEKIDMALDCKHNHTIECLKRDVQDLENDVESLEWDKDEIEGEKEDLEKENRILKQEIEKLKGTSAL
jgi:FtsZ-binding cell division protein ZapB